MAFFVQATRQERLDNRMSSCPPHIRKKWKLAMDRKNFKEQRKLSRATVEQSLPKVVRFVFEEDHRQWQSKLFADMLPEEQDEAKNLWKEAEEGFLQQLADADQ